MLQKYLRYNKTVTNCGRHYLSRPDLWSLHSTHVLHNLMILMPPAISTFSTYRTKASSDLRPGRFCFWLAISRWHGEVSQLTTKCNLNAKIRQKNFIGDVFERMQKIDSSTKGVLQLNDTSMSHITCFKDFADFARLRPNSLDLTREDLKFNHVNLTCLTLAHCSPRETDCEKRPFNPSHLFLIFSHFNRKCSSQMESLSTAGCDPTDVQIHSTYQPPGKTAIAAR